MLDVAPETTKTDNIMGGRRNLEMVRNTATATRENTIAQELFRTEPKIIWSLTKWWGNKITAA